MGDISSSLLHQLTLSRLFKLRAINRVAVASDMKMQQTVPKCSPLEDVSRDETKLVFPFAIDVTPHTDSKITGGVKEDEDKLNESKPIDNKAKDVITLTLLQKWGMTTILAVIGTYSSLARIMLAQFISRKYLYFL